MGPGVLCVYEVSPSEEQAGRVSMCKRLGTVASGEAWSSSLP
jgi:hypothetical protein